MKSLLSGLAFLLIAGTAMAQAPIPQNGTGSLPVPGMPLSYGQPQNPS